MVAASPAAELLCGFCRYGCAHAVMGVDSQALAQIGFVTVCAVHSWVCRGCLFVRCERFVEAASHVEDADSS